MKDEDTTEPFVRGQEREGGKKKKQRSHNHTGPNARSFRYGLSYCPVCDADKILRMTESERGLGKSQARDVVQRTPRDFRKS